MIIAADAIALTACEAACFDAVRDGIATKSRIALATRQDLKSVAGSLDALHQARLIDRSPDGGWRSGVADQGRPVRVVPDGGKRAGSGRLIAGSTAERLLQLLDQPKRGNELVEELRVSRQRVHQLVIRLHAQGRVRLGDPQRALHIVACADDSNLLLARDEECVLSAFPDDAATTPARLRAAVRLSLQRLDVTLRQLEAHGLIEPTHPSRGQPAYRLTSAGECHCQRHAARHAARHADPVPLKVKSDRVRDVLSYLDAQGAARIRDVRDALQIPHKSINALMQYLKRRGLVAKRGCDLHSAYELTSDGRTELAEMMRRASNRRAA